MEIYMKIGGIDIGTTGCKITVYNELGEFLHKEYESYEIDRNLGESEIDGAKIWNGVKSLIKRTTATIGNIDAIGVTSFGEAFVMLDENDTPLHPSILYTDPRGGEEAMSLDADMVTRIAGMKPLAMYSLPKIMWLKNNKPELYERAKRILLYEDFIVYMLSGVAQIDYSLAARTMALDIRRLCWSEEIFAAAGVDMGKMAKLVPSGTVAGPVRKSLEAELGLSGTIIVNGCHDQIAAAVGSGVLEAGEAVDGTGTVECVTPVFEAIPTQKEIYEGNYAIVPFIDKGKYVCYAVNFTGGASVKWFKDNFAKELSYKELDELVDSTPGNILLLPHFAGSGNPYMDNKSKAAFVGITLESTRADFYKAVLEGVCYEMKLNLEYLSKGGICPKELFATGGGASSPVWLQMKADILGVPITPLEAPEVGSVGTIMLTGVAIGAFKSVRDAKGMFVKCKKTYYPNPENQKKHDEVYDRYKKLYEAVRPLV